MKKILFSFAFLFICSCGFAQCPTEEWFSLETQEDIDNFKTNYPNCTALTSNLSISGTDITNLQGLNEIVSIGKQLSISRTNLNNLSGLENLISVGTNINITYNDWLSSLNGLSSIAQIGENFYLAGNKVLPNLGGLSNNIEIGGNLHLSGNAALNTLQLDGDYVIGKTIYVDGNNNLTSISDLNSIIQIQGLSITRNNKLNFITGLNNLKTISGDFILGGNALLSNVQGLNNLEAVGGKLEIGGNKSLQDLNGFGGLKSIGLNNENFETSFFLFSNENLTSLQAMSSVRTINGNITIKANNLDNLVGPFTNVSEITGSLYIYDTVRSFVGMENITRINDRLQIRDTEYVTNLTGFDGLEYIGGTLYLHSNDALVNLTGLENLKEIRGGAQISSHYALESLSGLNNLVKIGLFEEDNGTEFSIHGNENLTDFTGLNNLKSVNGRFKIGFNRKLKNLNGLQAIDTIGTVLDISGNSDLLDVSSLGGIKSIGEQQEFSNATTLILSNNDKIVSYNGLDVEKIKGKISIVGNAVLKEIGGFEQLQTADFIEILNNPLLEEIDSFNNLNNIEENLEIEGNIKLLNISGFTNLSEITENLTIDYNLVLDDISGFENLQKVNNVLISRNGFKRLNGLEKLNEVENLEIKENANLESFSEFTALTSAGQITIEENNALINLSGFENVETITQGYLSIRENALIEDLNGFNSLKKGGAGISIYYNPNLKSLYGLDALQEVSGSIYIYLNSSLTNVDALSDLYITGKDRTRFTISSNRSLAVCDLPSLCNYIASGRPHNVERNAGECNQYTLADICASQYNTISGTTRYSESSINCATSSFTLPNVKIISNNGANNFTSFSDENGAYVVHVKEGNNTFAPKPDTSLFTFNPTEGSHNFTQLGQQTVQDFCLSPTANNVTDVALTLLPLNDPRPGFDSGYELIYQNNGNANASGTVQLEFDEARATLINSSVNPDTESSNVLEWNFVDLTPYEKRKIRLSFNVEPPPTANINEILKFKNTINTGVTDAQPNDNVYILKQTLIGSYDPNDKTVIEGAYISINDVDNFLNYVVRFQNTGTASAINVRIEDELDSNLDWDTFEPISMSHSGSIQITDGNKVEFIFDNINLPDKDTDEPNSNGYVAFKIKPKSEIAIGDIITGTASIYFDFNPPIITNTVSTKIVVPDMDGDSIINEHDNCPTTPNPGQEDTDGNGIGDVCETEPLVVQIALVNPIACNGSKDAALEATVTGGTLPYSYELIDASSSAVLRSGASTIFDNLPSGSYYIVVTDVDSNQVQSTPIDIIEPAPLLATVTTIAMTCFENNDASATFEVSGGTGPYEFSIDGGVSFNTSNTFTNLASGVYIAMVRDNYGCTLDMTFQITQGFQISPVVGTTDASCNAADGSIAISIANLNEYLFSIEADADLTDFSTSNTFTNLESGTYTVSIAHNSGCLLQQTVEVGSTECSGGNEFEQCVLPLFNFSDTSVTSALATDMVVSPSGDMIVVGDRQGDMGSAFIYKNNNGSWSKAQKIVASDGYQYDDFGSSMAISGNQILLGAHGKNTTEGAFYVFTRNSDGNYMQTQKLNASDGTIDNNFGYAIAAEGNTAVVGAYKDNENGLRSGAAYIYEADANGTWSEKQKLVPSDLAAWDSYGSTVSISGDYIAVGSRHDDDLGTDSGSVYIFKKEANGSWIETQKLNASDGISKQIFGLRVTMQENTLAVSNFQDKGDGFVKGAVYVFEKDGNGDWLETQKINGLDETSEDFFAYNVSFYGKMMAISAHQEDGVDDRSGAVFIHEKSNSGIWESKTKLVACDGTRLDVFGANIKMIDGKLFINGRDLDVKGEIYGYAIENSLLLDTDGDGLVDSSDTSPNDPCFPIQSAGYIGFDGNNESWANADCDGDTFINGEEIVNQTDPYFFNAPEMRLDIATIPGNCYGKIKVEVTGGTAPYRYELTKVNDDSFIRSNSSGEFDRLASVEYLVKVTDANLESAQESTLLPGPAPLNIEQVVTHSSSPGIDDGSIELIVSGGTPPYQYHISQGSFNNTTAVMTTQNYFDNLTPGSYTVWIYDANRCSYLNYAIVLDGKFVLPVDNFTIETTSESCASSNNGSILIQAKENLDYSATLIGPTESEPQAFRTFTSFTDLEAGSYALCITMAGESSYEKCFTIQIMEPDDLEVDSKTDISGKTISLSLKGGTNYIIDVNGTEYFTTEDQITLPLSKVENSISVKTDKECQGVFEETILVTHDGLSIFPNPATNGDVTILLPSDNMDTEVLLTLFSQNGIRVLEKMENPEGRTVQINMDGMPPGVYTIIITSESQNSMRKIIKK